MSQYGVEKRMPQLKLGLPKGSLEKATIELFEKAGWLIKPKSRNYFPEIDDPELACSICRPQEMSRYVESGMLDAGITGKDWTLENQSDTVLVTELVYSKVSRKPTRWIIAVKGDSEITCIEDLEGKKVSTELVNVSKRFFAEKKINVEIEFSWGATEAKVVSGLVDAIVEVTETESTIRAHGLRIIYELMESNTQFIANKEAWNDPLKREKIENIALMLQGSLKAERIVALKMNVPEGKLENIIAVLPSLNAPTVANLYKTDWFSVETVVSSDVVRDLIPMLTKAGAEGIIEYHLSKVI
jgi:ATP phosphoribosyltransferase